jgi:hypothetical protein
MSRVATASAPNVMLAAASYAQRGEADDPEVLAEQRCGKAVQDVDDEGVNPADPQGAVESVRVLKRRFQTGQTFIARTLAGDESCVNFFSPG